MKYIPLLTERAKRDLGALDKRTAGHIITKLESYASSPSPLRFAKPLKGIFEGLHRYRIGDYRVIFRSERGGAGSVPLVVLRIGHRKDIYQ